MNFVKYHGLGNDFVIVKAVDDFDYQAIAQKVCDRHFGIGADGLVIVRDLGGGNRFQMRIFNSDGSECEMCGNATRCVAKYLNTPGVIELETKAGTIRPELLIDGTVRVDMGEPRVLAETIELNNYLGSEISMGNPHFVIFPDDLDTIDLAADGSKLEVHPYFPNKSNIEFAEVLAPDCIRMRVWERGCGITMACGTGSCATLVAGVITKRTGRKATVILDGGELLIEWLSNDNHIYMTGDATAVFEGTYYV